jgi:hypothetical protein
MSVSERVWPLAVGRPCVAVPGPCTESLVWLKCVPPPHVPLAAATYVNASMKVDDNNSAKVIYRCNPGNW